MDSSSLRPTHLHRSSSFDSGVADHQPEMRLAEPQSSRPLVASREGRSIEGATSAGSVGSVLMAETQESWVEHFNIPKCPEEHRSFIEETSLERLVYWKLQGLFEKVGEVLPENVLEIVLAHVERPLFALVLKMTKGNQSRAAKVLGCNRNTLHRKLKGFSIQPMELRRALKLRERKSINDVVSEALARNGAPGAEAALPFRR